MIAAQQSTGYVSFRKYQGAMKNIGSGADLVGSVTVTTIAEDLDLVRVTISGSGDDLRITVEERTGTNYCNVVCYVRYTETAAPGF
jgi:hypothetical protein